MRKKTKKKESVEEKCLVVFFCLFVDQKKKQRKQTVSTVLFFFPSSLSPSLLLFEKKKVLSHHHHRHDASSDQNRPTPRETTTTTTTPGEQTEEERAGGLRVRRRVRGVRRRRCVPKLVFFCILGENWISSIVPKNKRMETTRESFLKTFFLVSRCFSLARSFGERVTEGPLSLSLSPPIFLREPQSGREKTRKKKTWRSGRTTGTTRKRTISRRT